MAKKKEKEKTVFVDWVLGLTDEELQDFFPDESQTIEEYLEDIGHKGCLWDVMNDEPDAEKVREQIAGMFMQNNKRWAHYAINRMFAELVRLKIRVGAVRTAKGWKEPRYEKWWDSDDPKVLKGECAALTQRITTLEKERMFLGYGVGKVLQEQAIELTDDELVNLQCTVEQELLERREEDQEL